MEKHRVQCIGDIKSFSIFKKKMLAFAFLSLYFFLPVCDNTKLRIHKKKHKNEKILAHREKNVREIIEPERACNTAILKIIFKLVYT